jgi:hypothetical protein
MFEAYEKIISTRISKKLEWWFEWEVDLRFKTSRLPLFTRPSKQF